MLIRRVTVEEVRPLRAVVLRPDHPPEASVYDGDADGRHYAAAVDGELLGVVSYFDEPATAGPAADVRLRGMAVAAEARGRGVGSRLLLNSLVMEGGPAVWCNAREPAWAFYARHGFEPIGDRFDLPGIGVHRVMRRAAIGPAAADTEPRVEVVDVEAIRPLRHRVLREGLPISTTHFDGDDEATHFAAYIGRELVGCVSALDAPFPEEADLADRQLRGMATAPEHRRQGIGAMLVRALVKDDRRRRVWCNSRLAAAPLYERCGFTRVGGAFDVPRFGPHVVMLGPEAKRRKS